MYPNNPTIDARLWLHAHIHAAIRLVVLTPLLYLLFYPAALHAQDKSGVKPQVISLPSGPGSLEGLGENFAPNLSTGTSSYPVNFMAAPGRVGFQPQLALNYNGGNANGPWGMGWDLSIPSIQRRTEEGLPSYDDATDQFVFANGEKLVLLKDGSYRFENESTFMRFRRLPAGGWEGQTPDGLRYLFGETENSRVANPLGIFRWELARVIDPHGNEQRYSYLHDGAYAYPREIRYNFGQDPAGQEVYNAVIFNYAPRPDTYTDRRSGAPIRVGLRGTDIQMWSVGKLVRAYRFTYEPERSTGLYSLLIKVEQVGDDGASTLPPHTFTYTQFDPAAAQVVTMQTPPPVTLTNRDADLVDINADGLPDLVYTPEDGQHRFYLNRGHGRWATQPVIPANSPAERLSNPNVRMADMNGDGRVDLLVKASGTGAPLYYYRNQPGADWEKDDRIDFGPAPAFDLNDPNLQLLDVNNDHRIDVVLTGSGRMKIWLAREGAWSQSADFDVPAPAAGDTANFADPKFKVGDMTGDRMDDVVMVRDGQVVLWEHNGNGSYAEPRPILNPPSGVGNQDLLIQMGDLNNDGQMDLVLPGNRSVTYWLSLGDGSLTDPISIPNTPAFNAQETAVRLADIDGDGATELLFSSSESMAYVDFSTKEQPFLLRSVDNGLGRTILITYKSSIEDYITDWDANNPWQVNLPFPVQVVNRVTVHDANSGDDYIIDYHYRDGYYDGVQKEFRGFVRSQEIKVGDESAATTVTNLVYDVGMSDESRKGLLLASEVLAVGGRCEGDFTGCFVRTVNQLTTRVVVTATQTAVGQPIAYAYVSQTDSFVHEQQATPVQLRQTFAQDEYGNQTQSFNYGQVCGPQDNPDVTCGADELLTYTAYIYDQERYRFDQPQRVYQTDVAGNLVSDKRLYYDGEPYVGLPAGQLTRGDLTRQEESLGPNGTGRFIPTKRQKFDDYGNVIGMRDANDQLTTVEYDPLLHTFPILERLHLADGKSLAYAASYHYGFGKVSAATDYNGQPHTYIFDTFGRLSKIVHPGDTVAQPTQQFRYEIGNPLSAIISEHREQSGSDGVYTVVTYFDGLGRKLQTRSEAKGGQVVVTDVVLFNARQAASVEYLPYTDSGLAYKAPDPTLPHVTQVYDPLERIVRRQQPDGSFTTVVHQPLTQRLYDEEDNNPASPHYATPRTLVFDGLERLLTVEEVNMVNGAQERYVTRYRYDPLGYLTEIVDAQGNVKRQTFDALGRKLAIVDPDRGQAFFTYDNVGNVIETVDAKGQRIRNRYDAANRILSQNFVTEEGDDTPEVIYHYDADLAPAYPDAQNTQGRLAWVADESGAEYLSYDAVGNMTGRIKRINVPGSGESIDFAMRMRYDAMQRLVAYTYPDGTAQAFVYNEQAFLEAIPGYVTNIDYMALGKRSRIATADGALTTYDYDQRQRLTTLRTVGAQGTVYQDWRYQLDGISNILRIDDVRPGLSPAENASQSFAYDSLNRLLTTQYASGDQIDFGYDPLSNLVRKTSTIPGQNLGVFQMGQNAGPHAVTTVNGATWRYDANGNLVEKPNFTYHWDFRNRLTQVNGAAGVQQQNSYDYADQRMSKWVRNGATTELALYPDRSVEVRGDQLVKYIFANDQRVVEVRTPFDRSRLIRGFHGASDAPITPPVQGQTIFYHSDHLGSAAVLVDAEGKVVERRTYHPFGESHTQAGAPTADYSYTGKELDSAIGLYYYGARYYDPAAGRFISVDPLYFEQPEKELADPQMLNLYAYARNNPVQNTDPDGRDVVIAYGVGHFERLSRTIANKMAKDLRRENIRVYVMRATDLRKAAVQQRMAGKPISAAVFIGHGNNQDLIALRANETRSGIVSNATSSPSRFATMAGVERGGVVAMLSCNAVTGQTASERALAKRGITTIGFNNDFEGRGDGLVRSVRPFEPIDLNPTSPPYDSHEWVKAVEVRPHVQTGPKPIDSGSMGDHIRAAEERVNPPKPDI